jgi:ribosomal protein L9
VKFDAKELEEKTAAEAVGDADGARRGFISRSVGETEALYGSVTSATSPSAAEARLRHDKRKNWSAKPIKKLGETERCR